MDDDQFRQLLHRRGLSWKGYRRVRKGVKRRIRRHMQTLGCHTVGAYLAELDKSEQARQQCERLMTVSISRFFRDRRLWQVLQEEVLPPLIKKEREKANVWSAGCACGEEVYSFKIVWDTLKGTWGRLPELEILATDMNPIYLDRARAGIYPLSSLREVRQEIRSTYFQMQIDGGLYAIKASLKRDITWQVRHLLSNPPGFKFHIIFLRNNLLTYYQDELKVPAFKKTVSSLSPGGFLIIGSHERLPFKVDDLLPFGSLSYVFKKQE